MFRDLKAEEIECRIQSVKENGIVLLLYKDARCDMRILDETVGPCNWACRYYEHKGILFCEVGINTNYFNPELPDRWIWKGDGGSESATEAEKGACSDARKRAGFCWGIGRELYTTPFIFIPESKCSINDRGKCFDKFEVEKIKVEDKRITGLSIRNVSRGIRAFVWMEEED